MRRTGRHRRPALHGIRLSLHPAHYVRLSSSTRRVDGARHAGTRPLHSCSTPWARARTRCGRRPRRRCPGGDAAAGRAALRALHNSLAPATRRRLALENDDRHYALADSALDSPANRHPPGARRPAPPLSRSGKPAARRCAGAGACHWPPGNLKIHFSSPAPSCSRLYRHGQWRGKCRCPTSTATSSTPSSSSTCCAWRVTVVCALDIMLEAKAMTWQSCAYANLLRYAPDLSPCLR